jgi:cytosine/adenosine deaminase-related metal-dependent hydrolase
MISLGLSIAAVILSVAAAYTGRRVLRHSEQLASRYADAIALVVLVARSEPPVADPELRAACDRLLARHGIEVTASRPPPA